MENVVVDTKPIDFITKITVDQWSETKRSEMKLSEMLWMFYFFQTFSQNCFLMTSTYCVHMKQTLKHKNIINKKINQIKIKSQCLKEQVIFVI